MKDRELNAREALIVWLACVVGMVADCGLVFPGREIGALVMTDDRAGTTEYDRRERQEFAGIRAFAPLGDTDPVWAALRNREHVG